MDGTNKIRVPHAAAAPTESIVTDVMQEGFQNMAVQASMGLAAGLVAGLVLARGGGGSTRKIMAGFGGGVGLGSAWTRCSIQLEDALGVSSTSGSSTK